MSGTAVALNQILPALCIFILLPSSTAQPPGHCCQAFPVTASFGVLLAQCVVRVAARTSSLGLSYGAAEPLSLSVSFSTLFSAPCYATSYGSCKGRGAGDYG